MTHRTHFRCQPKGASYLISLHIFEYLRDPAPLTTSPTKVLTPSACLSIPVLIVLSFREFRFICCTKTEP